AQPAALTCSPEATRASDSDCTEDIYPPELPREAPALEYRPPPPAPKPRIIASIAIGGGYRAFYDANYGAGAFDLRFGADLKQKAELTASVLVESGAPTVRLPVSSLLLGLGLRGIIRERWRLGMVLRMGAVFFNRITNGSYQHGAGFRLTLDGSVDLARNRRAALFLGAEIGFDAKLFEDWQLLGGSTG